MAVVEVCARPTASSREMDPAFCNWLAGFIDGEGCFSILRTNYGSYTTRMFLRLRDDDEGVLLDIIANTGIGKMQYLPANGTTRKNGLVQWCIQSTQGCLDLIAILDEHPLRAKKRRDYAIWKEAVEHRAGERGTTGRDWTPMANYKAQLEAVRRYT